MKKLLSLVGAIIIAATTFAQSYNSDLNDLGQYVQRMYLNEPFEGARIVENVDKCYLITVVAERSGKNDYATNRKAEVKGLSYANTFLNGAVVSQNTVVHTKENSRGYSFEEIEDFIESRSMGYVQTMQLLSTFTGDKGKKVFVYCKQLPMPEKPQGKKNRKRK
ncbi:MAG: hypothetical protein K6F10_02590 [Paludibacteraceae bacterium]|nr:hypothetical protein [Paludibacteraceae bacterium]